VGARAAGCRHLQHLGPQGREHTRLGRHPTLVEDVEVTAHRLEGPDPFGCRLAVARPDPQQEAPGVPALDAVVRLGELRGVGGPGALLVAWVAEVDTPSTVAVQPR